MDPERFRKTDFRLGFPNGTEAFSGLAETCRSLMKPAWRDPAIYELRGFDSGDLEEGVVELKRNTSVWIMYTPGQLSFSVTQVFYGTDKMIIINIDQTGKVEAFNDQISGPYLKEGSEIIDGNKKYVVRCAEGIDPEDYAQDYAERLILAVEKSGVLTKELPNKNSREL